MDLIKKVNETSYAKCQGQRVSSPCRLFVAALMNNLGLVVGELDSRLEGRGFEFHPMLDGNGVKAMPWIDYCTQSWFI